MECANNNSTGYAYGTLSNAYDSGIYITANTTGKKSFVKENFGAFSLAGAVRNRSCCKATSPTAVGVGAPINL